MERGDAAKFKGKTLDEIDVNIDEEIILDCEADASNNVVINSSNALDMDIVSAECKDEEKQKENINLGRTENDNKTKERKLVYREIRKKLC